MSWLLCCMGRPLIINKLQHEKTCASHVNSKLNSTLQSINWVSFFLLVLYKVSYLQ
jgi:hypothetical protein